MEKVIIAGCRTFTHYPALSGVMDGLYLLDRIEVVSGGARGVDALGEQYAKDCGHPVTRFPADWETHGKAAGPIRNRKMAAYADTLVAFWDGESRGTKNMIEEARKQGLKVHVVSI